MDRERFFDDSDRYYERTLSEHGATARGVGWKSHEARQVRYDQLAKLVPADTRFTINDYGCGYGAFAHDLRERGHTFDYHGFDISERMLELAAEQNLDPEHWRFTSAADALEVADYTVASGVFNLRLTVPDDEWRDYVCGLIESIAAISRRGFAFNMLTSYSDPERMEPHLYYGDPCFFFHYCKRHFAPDVALLHDYGEYEFTILARQRESTS